MGVKDIMKSSSVINLFSNLRSIPASTATTIKSIFQAKNNEERIQLLASLPEDILKKLLKVFTYMFLSSGVILRESAHEIYLTPEIKSFFEKVKGEVDKLEEFSMKTVSAAVDIVVGTAAAATYIGIIALGVICILNPPVGLAIGGMTLFLELFMLLLPEQEKTSSQGGK
jgi:hypothetical protein